MIIKDDLNSFILAIFYTFATDKVVEVIHLGRMRDKTRKVLEINEVVGIRNGQIELNRLYVFKEEPESDKNKVVGQLERTENPLINKQKLERKGLA